MLLLFHAAITRAPRMAKVEFEARFLERAGSALREGGYLVAGTSSIAVACYALNVEAILGPPVPRENEMDLLKENLVRLRVLATVVNAGDITFGDDPNLRLARADTGVVCMAPLGIALLEAVASAQTSE